MVAYVCDLDFCLLLWLLQLVGEFHQCGLHCDHYCPWCFIYNSFHNYSNRSLLSTFHCVRDMTTICLAKWAAIHLQSTTGIYNDFLLYSTQLLTDSYYDGFPSGAIPRANEAPFE